MDSPHEWPTLDAYLRAYMERSDHDRSSGVDLRDGGWNGLPEDSDTCYYGDASCFPMPEQWQLPKDDAEMTKTKMFVVTLEFENGRKAIITVRDDPGREATTLRVEGLRHVDKQTLETYVIGGWTEKRAT